MCCVGCLAADTCKANVVPTPVSEAITVSAPDRMTGVERRCTSAGGSRMRLNMGKA
jgi:hypothetical protein